MAVTRRVFAQTLAAMSVGSTLSAVNSQPALVIPRMERGAAVVNIGKRIWVPSESWAGDNVNDFLDACRKNHCEYVLWNGSVRGVDLKYNW